MADKTHGLGRIILMIAGIGGVLTCSMVLLVYVGFGDANRTYPKMKLEQVAAQGLLLQRDMNEFLLAGLPLEQFPGFDARTRSLIGGSSPITSITANDLFGNIIFPKEGALKLIDEGWKRHPLNDPAGGYEILQNDLFVRIVFPLLDAFDTVGEIRLDIPRNVIDVRLAEHFRSLIVFTAVLALVSSALIVPVLRMFGSRGLKALCAIAFLGVAAFLVVSLVRLYTEGIQEKTDAVATSLSHRLESATQLGLPMDIFAGLEQLFAEYKNLYPEIGDIALVDSDRILVSSGIGMLGAPFVARTDQFDTSIELGSRHKGQGRLRLHVLHVLVPKEVVWGKLWRSVKNFLVLFLASAFFAVMFLNLVTTLARKREFSAADVNLQLIAPVYFLAIYVFGLNVSFLPRFMEELARQSHANPSLVPAVFTTYFAAFGFTLIPAGRFADRRGVKGLLLMGSLLTCLAMALMALSPRLGFAMTFPIRALEGVGQAMLFIGTQAFAFRMAPEKKTEGAALIVIGYSGGMIAGTAIGALLLISMSEVHVFLVGTFVAFFAFLFILGFIPAVSEKARPEPGSFPERMIRLDMVVDPVGDPGATEGFVSNLLKGLRDPGFLTTVLFVGMPTKAVATGVTIFALPLVLAQQDYLKEDIGQVLMFYAIGMLLVTKYVSRYVDRSGKPARLLLWGCVIGAAGLLLVGWGSQADIASQLFSMRGADTPYLGTVLIVSGLLALGIGHGFIHAPVVTHVAQTRTSATLGMTATTAVYRFLERLGHLLGPIILGVMLAAFGSGLALLYLATATVAFGMCFAVGNLLFQRRRPGADGIRP